MSDHHQANEYSQNSAGEVKKKTTPAAHSESVNHFYDAADQKQPSKDQRGSEAGCWHHVERDRSQNHHQDPENQYPTPLRTKDFQPKRQPIRNHMLLQGRSGGISGRLEPVDKSTAILLRDNKIVLDRQACLDELVKVHLTTEVLTMMKIRRAFLRCSFCRKSESKVAKLIAGKRGYICDVCVA